MCLSQKKLSYKSIRPTHNICNKEEDESAVAPVLLRKKGKEVDAEEDGNKDSSIFE